MHDGHVIFRVRMYMCSCFTATSDWQCGQMFEIGMRLSCVSVATCTMPKRRASVP